MDVESGIHRHGIRNPQTLLDYLTWGDLVVNFPEPVNKLRQQVGTHVARIFDINPPGRF